MDQILALLMIAGFIFIIRKVTTKKKFAASVEMEKASDVKPKQQPVIINHERMMSDFNDKICKALAEMDEMEDAAEEDDMEAHFASISGLLDEANSAMWMMDTIGTKQAIEACKKALFQSRRMWTINYLLYILGLIPEWVETLSMHELAHQSVGPLKTLKRNQAYLPDAFKDAYHDAINAITRKIKVERDRSHALYAEVINLINEHEGIAQCDIYGYFDEGRKEDIETIIQLAVENGDVSRDPWNDTYELFATVRFEAKK